MNITNKKLTAALAAVSFYIQMEEESLIMSPPKKKSPRKFDQGNLWGISGRQNLMQMRTIMQVRTLNR